MAPAEASQQPLAKVLLRAADPDQERCAEEFLRRLGYSFVTSPPSFADLNGSPDIILLIAGSGVETITDYFSKRPSLEYPPPVVVFGASELGGEWRKAALDNGAFACLSIEAPVEERACAVVAASRFRAAQMEIKMLRRESDLLCTRLLTSYGEEVQKLRAAQKERREVQEALESIKNRILRSIL